MRTKPPMDQITICNQHINPIPGQFLHTGGTGHDWQERVHKRVDEESGEVVSDVYEELMPSLSDV